MADEPGQRFNPWHGWLSAVLPANVRRLRVNDSELAATLDGSGAELVDSQPEVEIGPVEGLRGDAGRAIATIAFEPGRGPSQAIRAAARGVGSLRLRAVARHARRKMKLLGYPDVVTIGCDLGHVLHLPGKSDPPRRVVEHLPLRAIILGTRGDGVRTVLDAAVEAAAADARSSLDGEAPILRTSGLVVLGDTDVLRVAIGPARHQLESQRAALSFLAVEAPTQIRERIPSTLAHGTAGVGDWSLESKLGGAGSRGQVAEDVLDDCVAFLVSLHTASSATSEQHSITANADVVAAVCVNDHALALRRLTARLDERLADLPRGFAHGDFWAGNLLVDAGRLVGVIDWSGAGPGRLPLLDLVHLHVSASRWTSNVDLGPTIVNESLPWARNGGAPSVRAYCQRLGLDLTRSQLESLVVAYWLDRVASELRTFRHRSEPSWIRRNVLDVLEGLVSRGYERPLI